LKINPCLSKSQNPAGFETRQCGTNVETVF